MRLPALTGAAAAAALGGCGFNDGGILQGVPNTFEPPRGATEAGATDVGEVTRRPTWRIPARDGDRLEFGLTLRNEGSNIVTVSGVRRDPDGDDQVFAPLRLRERVAIPPDQERPVVVLGRVDGCAQYAPQLVAKNGQIFVTDGSEEHEVALRALLEIECEDPAT